MQDSPERLSQANPKSSWRWAGPVSRRPSAARSVVKLAPSKSNGAAPPKNPTSGPIHAKNRPLTPRGPHCNSMAPCLVSPKTNSLSPAQR